MSHSALHALTRPNPRIRSRRRPSSARRVLLHRYYDPATGQFLSVDPVVSLTGQPYAYAGDDPVTESDPTGMLAVGSGGPTCLPLGNPNNLVCITPSTNPVACQKLLVANGLSGSGLCPAQNLLTLSDVFNDVAEHVNVQYSGCVVICSDLQFADGHLYATLGGGYGISPSGFSLGFSSEPANTIGPPNGGVSASLGIGGSYYWGNTTSDSACSPGNYWAASAQGGIGFAWLGGWQKTIKLF